MCTHINDKMTSYMNQSVITYLNESGMSDNTTWATDAEIIGCASFMGIDIKVYSKYGEKFKWLTYPCSLPLTQLSEHAIFLDNSTASSFNVVLFKKKVLIILFITFRDMICMNIFYLLIFI